MKRLTKSQYEAIAERIRRVFETLGYDSKEVIGLYDLEFDLSQLFAKTDTEFDRRKFLELCGIKD